MSEYNDAEPDFVFEQLVSIIHSNPNGPSIVVNHSLCDGINFPQVIPGATGYSFLITTSEPLDDDRGLQTRIKKSTDSLEKLCFLLRSSPNEPSTETTTQSPTITIGSEAFISSPQLSNKQKNIDRTEIYSKLLLRFSNGTTSAQYFYSHCSAIKSAFLSGPFPAQFQRIDINTGICLFSSVTISTPPGHDYPSLPQNERPTIYELEIIMRLSTAVADTVALIGRSHVNSGTPISINVDVPDFQYYWTACELLRQNFVPVHYVQSWMARVNERRNRIKNILTSVLSTMLEARQLHKVDINITPGTEAAVTLIEEKISLGIIPSLEELLTTLQSQGPDAARWREFMKHLDKRDYPSTIVDLGRLAYIFKTVRTALQKDSSMYFDCCHKNHLIIQVDDVNEWRILDRAKRFLRKHSRKFPDSSKEPIVVGLFPMQKIFAAGLGRTNLYIDDPGFRFCLDSEKATVDPLDVIDASYGLHTGNLLRRLCHQEGFS